MAELFDPLQSGPVLRTFVQYLITFSSRLETASDVISGKFVRPIVRHKHTQFCDSRLNRSREIPPEVVECGIFVRFSNVDHFQPEVVSDVMSDAVVDPVGMKVLGNFSDFRHLYTPKAYAILHRFGTIHNSLHTNGHRSRSSWW